MHQQLTHQLLWSSSSRIQAHTGGPITPRFLFSITRGPHLTPYHVPLLFCLFPRLQLYSLNRLACSPHQGCYHTVVLGAHHAQHISLTLLPCACVAATAVSFPALQLYGYFYSLSRYGLMATALLDTSNTLLHAAKALNYADIPHLERTKDIVSKSFALVFFSCRVVLPPFSLIKPGLLDGRRLPLTSYYITNGMLLFIYSLQLFWFHKILKIILGHETHEGHSTKPTATAEVQAAAPAGEKKEK